MPSVKLTDAERLILANQHEILGHLKGDEDHLRMAENLRDGHEWLYAENAARISDNLPKNKVEHVLTILDIYSDMAASYDELSDKSGIDRNQIAFPGFDGNNEIELLGFSRALSRSDHYTGILGENGINSHMPTTDIYERMITEWRSLGEPRYPLEKDHMLRILSARTHPDYRK